jgi:hypothetical protein
MAPKVGDCFQSTAHFACNWSNLNYGTARPPSLTIDVVLLYLSILIFFLYCNSIMNPGDDLIMHWLDYLCLLMVLVSIALVP